MFFPTGVARLRAGRVAHAKRNQEYTVRGYRCGFVTVQRITVGADLCVCPKLDIPVELGEHKGSPRGLFLRVALSLQKTQAFLVCLHFYNITRHKMS